MYKIIPAQSFERNAKPLLKKYPSLRDELHELGEQLSLNPIQGTLSYYLRQAGQS